METTKMCRQLSRVPAKDRLFDCCSLPAGRTGEHRAHEFHSLDDRYQAWPNDADLVEPKKEAEAVSTPSPAYLRTLRDRAAVAAMDSLIGLRSYDYAEVAQEAASYASALVAALYSEEVRDE